MSEFDFGVVYAAVLMGTWCGNPTAAIDVLKEAGLLSINLDTLDDTERNTLIEFQKDDRRCNFTLSKP